MGVRGKHRAGTDPALRTSEERRKVFVSKEKMKKGVERFGRMHHGEGRAPWWSVISDGVVEAAGL